MRYFIMFLIPLYLFGAKIDPKNPRYSWMDKQIEQDLAPYSKGISKERLDSVEKLWYRFHRYKIVNNVVYGPDSKIKVVLARLCAMYTMQDTDFLYLNEDGFIFHATKGKNPPATEGPVFGGTKHSEFANALFFADWSFDPTRIDERTCNKYYDWPLTAKLVTNASKAIPWGKKKPLACWRGGLQGYQYDYSPSGLAETPRGAAALASIENPEMIDAGFSWAPETSQQMDTLYKHGIYVYKPFLDHPSQISYKYLLDIDGHTCTYPGLQWKLLSNCTVLKQETANKMWYYAVLKPWVHYVPLKNDLSDLVEKVQWCIDHDEEAKTIALRGQAVAKRNLMPEHCMLYCYKALQAYSKLLTFQPAVE